MWSRSKKDEKVKEEEKEALSRAERLRDVLFVPVGTSGSMMFWMINFALGTKGKLKALAFASGIDKKFLVNRASIDPNNVINIHDISTAGDPRLAEAYYLNQRNHTLYVLGRNQPFRSILIFTFTGGGTQRCAYLFTKDVLEEFGGPSEFPKILVVAKLPVHNQWPEMIRNTKEFLKNLKELHEKYPKQLSIVVFSDGLNLSQVEPRLREMLIKEKINWPDTTNAPAGDWCAAILSAFSRPETDVTNLFSFATQPPLEGTYGPFAVPIIIRASAEGGRDRARDEISSKIDQLPTVVDVTTLQDVKFTARENAGIFGCLYAPPVEDPDEQQRELLTLSKALETSLNKNLGVKKPTAHLSPIYKGEKTMEILGLLRGIEFSFYNGEVDSGKL